MTPLLTTPPSKFGAIVDSHKYPLPWAVGINLLWAAVLGKRRSFAWDARACVSLLDPSLKIQGDENIPQNGPCLVIANHYSRPGFHAWWIALAISASLPFEVHWVITSSWRLEWHPFSQLLQPLTRWGFNRAAQVYGFTTFPPMPPKVEEIKARSQAVRRLLNYARRASNPVIGLLPEGYDTPGGVLGTPPPGIGRLVVHLNPYIHSILPMAVFEENERLNLAIGETLTIETPTQTKPDEIDRYICDILIRAIARLLPSLLRGTYQ